MMLTKSTYGELWFDPEDIQAMLLMHGKGGEHRTLEVWLRNLRASLTVVNQADIDTLWKRTQGGAS